MFGGTRVMPAAVRAAGIVPTLPPQPRQQSPCAPPAPVRQLA